MHLCATKTTAHLACTSSLLHRAFSAGTPSFSSIEVLRLFFAPRFHPLTALRPLGRSGHYAGAILKFHVNFPWDYPEHPPVVQFVTDIFHPLIGPDGSLSMAPRFRPWR